MGGPPQCASACACVLQRYERWRCDGGGDVPTPRWCCWCDVPMPRRWCWCRWCYCIIGKYQWVPSFLLFDIVLDHNYASLIKSITNIIEFSFCKHWSFMFNLRLKSLDHVIHLLYRQVDSINFFQFSFKMYVSNAMSNISFIYTCNFMLILKFLPVI